VVFLPAGNGKRRLINWGSVSPDTAIDEAPLPRKATAPPRWQFGLAHLFGLTTLSAIAAALVAAFGLGSLPISIGVSLAGVNYAGLLRPLQSGRPQAALLWLAWATFLISLALPSLHVFGPVAGWEAGWAVLAMPVEAVRKGDLLHVQLLWFLMLDLANLLAVLLPLLVWRLRRSGGRWYAAVLCVVTISPWSVGWDTPMLPGYYVWCLSFLLALAALPIGRKTLAAMFASLLLHAAAAVWLG
jgi:hypothetical protein